MPTHQSNAREFKLETVKLVTERKLPRAQVARDVGIDVQTLRRWIKEFAVDGARVVPGQDRVHDEEVIRLRRENDRLRQERDILNKALGIFSRMPDYVTNIVSLQTKRASTQSPCCATCWASHAVAFMRGDADQKVRVDVAISSS